MKYTTYLRVFIDSPNQLDLGYEFVDLLGVHLRDIANIEEADVERYYKISSHVKVTTLIAPINTDNSLIDNFQIIKEKLGSGWSDEGTTILCPNAIWVKNESNIFFTDNVVWANLGTGMDSEETEEAVEDV
jgi:hypothetical protein